MPTRAVPPAPGRANLGSTSNTTSDRSGTSVILVEIFLCLCDPAACFIRPPATSCSSHARTANRGSHFSHPTAAALATRRPGVYLLAPDGASPATSTIPATTHEREGHTAIAPGWITSLAPWDSALPNAAPCACGPTWRQITPIVRVQATTAVFSSAFPSRRHLSGLSFQSQVPMVRMTA